MEGLPLLSLMLLVPLVGAAACFFAGAQTARLVALGTTLVTFALGLLLWANFDICGPQWQFTERAGLADAFNWAPAGKSCCIKEGMSLVPA